MTDAEFRKAVYRIKTQVAARVESSRKTRQVAVEAVTNQNYWNSWAEISGGIGMTALISAGFMFAGALIAKGIGTLATAIAEELMLATRGLAVRRAMVHGTVTAFRGLSQVFGRFATFGQGLKISAENAPALIAASNGLIARLMVGGTSILLSEAFKSNAFRAEGIRIEDRRFFKTDLQWRILTMVALAYIGRPGAPKNTSFLTIVKQLPGMKSMQGAVQGANLFNEMRKSAGRDDPLGVVWQDLGDKPDAINAAISAAATMTLEQLLAQAVSLEDDYLEFYYEKIKDKDYTQQFSWYTRFGMTGWPAATANAMTGSWLWGRLGFFNSENTIDTYNFLCRTIILESAKLEFWCRVGKSIDVALAETEMARKTAARRAALWKAQGQGSGTPSRPLEPHEMLR